MRRRLGLSSSELVALFLCACGAHSQLPKSTLAAPSGAPGQTSTPAKDALDEARKKGTVASYENVIEHFPGTHESAEAEVELDKLHFRTAEQQRSVQGYQDYLARNERGAFVAAARTALRRLAFETAVSANTVSAYQTFLKDNVDDEFTREGHARLETCSFEAARAEDTPKAYRRFIELYPSGEKTTEAKIAMDTAEGNAILKQYDDPESANGSIPETYLGTWVHRDDSKTTDFLVISPRIIVMRAADGEDTVVGRGQYRVTEDGLRLSFERPRPFTTRVDNSSVSRETSGYMVAPNIGNFSCDNDGTGNKDIILPTMPGLKGRACTAWAEITKVPVGRTLPLVKLSGRLVPSGDAVRLVSEHKRMPFRCHVMELGAMFTGGPARGGWGTCTIEVGGVDRLYQRPGK